MLSWNRPMIDFAAARRMMVDSQVRTSDVTDLRIIAAMLELARERFVPASSANLAYLDRDLPVSQATGGEAGRRLLKPMVLAKMLQAAAVKTDDHVLDVGCATGYSSAVLARLAGSVVALEEDEILLKHAHRALAGIANVTLVAGPLTAGVPSNGPYDVIVLEGGTEIVPNALMGQLKDGGRLACVLGHGPGSKAMLYRRIEGQLSGRPIFDATAPLLPGFAKPPAFVF